MKAKKSLGQHFLIDNNINNKLVSAINASENDLIVEIGPGLGSLTKSLKKKGATIIAYEIDNDLMNKLRKLEDDKTNFYNKDILKVNIDKEIENINHDKLFIVGNLPYYITTPIIKKMILVQDKIEEMIFMVQEEVADRFTALPNTKNYSSLTLYLKFYFTVDKLFKVSKKCFDPIPNVESAVVRFSKRKNTLNVDKNSYFKLLEDAFQQKRKTLKNNLKKYDWSIIKEILMKYGYEETVRAEQIEEKVFVEIVNILNK